MESHLASPAAFVEGGILDACDDACSICLESFTENDPSTGTSCKHEFHLQCILEWCQRSSQCPMCWQTLSLKDATRFILIRIQLSFIYIFNLYLEPVYFDRAHYHAKCNSQELFEAIASERNIRVNCSRNSTIFHYPILGDLQLQHLPVGANGNDLEERLIRQLATAAAMGRAYQASRSEGQRGRSSSHVHPQFLVISADTIAPSLNSVPGSSTDNGGDNEPEIVPISSSPSEPPRQDSENTRTSTSVPVFSNSRSFAGQSSLNNQDSGGPSDLPSFSESLKSRLSSASMRYKDSISESTRGWREKLFSRNVSMSDIGSEMRREVNAGIATVSRMMERFDMRENSRASSTSLQSVEGQTDTGVNNERIVETNSDTHRKDCNVSASCTSCSDSN